MIDSLRTEIEQTLTKLAKESTTQPLEALIEQLEKAYEKLLVADFLEKRAARRNALQKQVIAELGRATADDNEPILAPTHSVEQPERRAEPVFSMTPEIKIVPAPDGPPPMPNHEMEQMKEPKPEQETVFIDEPIATPVAERIDLVPPGKVFAPVAKAPEPVKKETLSTSPTSIAEKAQAQHTQKSLHTKLASKHLTFGLNDRLAYVKHLFDGSTDDFNRVVSQLSTFEDWAETQDFIANMVKPDFDWSGKEAYEERFLAQIKSRFE